MPDRPALGRRVGLFGGSFNPPHVAHLAVAEACADQLDLDTVLWMPAAAPPHKRDDAALAHPEHRVAMVTLGTAGNDRFAVSTLEVDRAGVSYTVDTLRALHAAHPDTEWTLLMGGDSLEDFTSWREPDDISRLARLAVYPRPGRVPSPSPFAATVVDAPSLDLSSTQIRARLRGGRSVRYLIPDAVRAYITQHGLYAD